MTNSRSEVDSPAMLARRYIAVQPPNARRYLGKVRSIIRSVAPGASEHFSYGIPGFRLDGRPLVWYAAWKNHISLYPMTTAIRHKFATQIKGYKTSKGTIQFPLDRPLPVLLVKRLVKARVAEVTKT